MSLVQSSQGASGTPATDMYNTLATALSGAGWSLIDSPSAATAGTTAACKVWASASTTGPVSSIYTGCLLIIEIDDTNSRLRFRCCENYDTSQSGSPALNIARPCPGNQSGTSQTPTVNSAFPGADTTYVAIFQTQGTSAKVGWVNIPVGGGGFSYKYGILGDDFFYTNNSGRDNFVLAGLVNAAVFVSLLAAGDAGVYLAGAMSTTNNNVSWTYSGATNGGNLRTSREPLNTGAAVTGGFCFMCSTAVPHPNPSAQSDTSMGTIGNAHLYHQSMVVTPTYVHGCGSSACARPGASHRASLTGFICFTSTEPQWGNTVTADGTSYICVGPSAGSSQDFLAVDPAAY